MNTSHARLGTHIEPLVPLDEDNDEFLLGPPGGLDNEWMRWAACLDAEPEIFFPPGPTAYQHIAEAKAVCRGCPVVENCLRVAMADPTLGGVWGGLSEFERARLRQR